MICSPLGRRRGFSLLELIIVVVIMGTIAAIALPRVSSATERARDRVLLANEVVLQKAVDLYIEEHQGLTPAHIERILKNDGAEFEARLIKRTNGDGDLDDRGLYGPYLRAMPKNTVNDLRTVRIDGAVPGQGTHGWRFDSNRSVIESDTEKAVASK